MPTTFGFWIFMLWLSLMASPAQAQPEPAALPHLRQGVSITGWFRYPASRDPAALARWMSDTAMEDLRRAGFDFVRLAMDPEVLEASAPRAVAVAAVCRLQRHGLAVVVDAHPTSWHLETSAADRARLRAFWRTIGRDLGRCDPRLTVPEILNEPVFPGDGADWAALQHEILRALRADLPDSTIVLTGNDWGSIAGLLTLTPEADPNVVYSFHFYDPPELTALAAYRPGLDRTALARLPFPVSEQRICEAAAPATGATWDVIRYYCLMAWNRTAVEQRITRAVTWARDHRVALIAGEFGATNGLNSAARLAWLGAVRQALEMNGIGWALWGYDDVMGLAVQRPPVSRPILDGNVLAALGLPRRR